MVLTEEYESGGVIDHSHELIAPHLLEYAKSWRK